MRKGPAGLQSDPDRSVPQKSTKFVGFERINILLSGIDIEIRPIVVGTDWVVPGALDVIVRSGELLLTGLKRVTVIDGTLENVWNMSEIAV